MRCVVVLNSAVYAWGMGPVMGQTASASKVCEVMFCRSMSVSRPHPMDKRSFSSAADREKSWSIGPIDYWPWFSIALHDAAEKFLAS